MTAPVLASPCVASLLSHANPYLKYRLVTRYTVAYSIKYRTKSSNSHNSPRGSQIKWVFGPLGTGSRQCHILQPNPAAPVHHRHMSSVSNFLQQLFVVSADASQPNVSSDATAPAASESVSAALPTSLDEAIEYIPPPPVPAEELAPVLNALGEPTFESLGLGGWTPVGIMQSCLEAIHVSTGLPWWGTIALATVGLRTLIFPLVLKAQRNAAKMNNNLPQMQILQMKMTEARNAGDQLNASRYAHEMVEFMKEKDISPLKNVIVPLAQAPLFISMFLGLRKMANLPLESMTVGGMYWFVDLTVSDPYYLLPVLTTFTMFATIELGTDGAKLSAQNMQTMKYVLRALPFVVLPFTVNFPTAILCYWVSTNVFSLVQVGFLKIPRVRAYFKIDASITHKKETLPQQKGAVEGFKESWRNMKIAREIADRERYDDIRFKKAGTGPIVRTYTHDPTKKIINVQAKVKNK